MTPKPQTPKPQILEFEALQEQLDAGRIVPLTVACWEGLQARYEVREEIATGLSGSLLLLRRPQRKPGWAVVEEPEPQVRVVRPLASEREAQALIADRLAAYERMWDG